jgi:hypothetical protein
MGRPQDPRRIELLTLKLQVVACGRSLAVIDFDGRLLHDPMAD